MSEQDYLVRKAGAMLDLGMWRGKYVRASSFKKALEEVLGYRIWRGKVFHPEDGKYIVENTDSGKAKYAIVKNGKVVKMWWAERRLWSQQKLKRKKWWLEKYWCSKCHRYHMKSSKIGKAHRRRWGR